LIEPSDIALTIEQKCQKPPMPPQLVIPITSQTNRGGGIEPSDDFDATDFSLCDCENCQQCRAANALHSECLKSRFLASLDVDLQCLIERWSRLDESARQICAAYVGELVEVVS
jgi:hypothetical protein